VGDALQFPASALEKDFSRAPTHPGVDAYKAYKQMSYGTGSIKAIGIVPAKKTLLLDALVLAATEKPVIPAPGRGGRGGSGRGGFGFSGGRGGFGFSGGRGGAVTPAIVPPNVGK
jgi:hypothetical protein